MRETGAHDAVLEGDDVGVSAPLPTGTVTLLLADVEDSTHLWEIDAAAMTAAVVALDDVVSATVAEFGGVRPGRAG